MTTSAQIALISRQELEKLSREHIELKTGDKLEGEVVNVRQDGKTVVDFGRFQAALELKAPVEKGDVISVVVVEKGKQIKLKLEQVQSKTKIPPDVQKAVKHAESIQARSPEEIQRQTQSDRATRGDVELPTDKNKADFFKGEPRAQDLKDSLVKLKQILKSPGNISIKNLSGEIKGILDTLQAYGDSLDIGEKIAKPTAQLNNHIRSGDAGIPVDKEVRQILDQLMDAVGRIAKMKTIEQLPEIKTIIQQELKPNLQQLQEIVQRETSRAEHPVRQPPEDVKKAVDELLKNMEKAIEKLPDKIVHRGDGSQPRDVDVIVKQISQLRTLVENSRIPLDKEASEALNKLSEAAAKIGRAKAPEQSQEIKTIIDNEIKPNLHRLGEAVTRELPRLEPQNREAAREIKQAVENIQKNIDRRSEPPPERTDVRHGKVVENVERTPEPAAERAEVRPEKIVETVVKEISNLRTRVENAPIPMEKETAAIITRLTEAAERISLVKTTEQLPEIRPVIENRVKPDLLELKQAVDRRVVRAEPVQQRAAGEIKEAVDNTLETLEKTLERLPDKLKTSEQIETLLNEIKNIRRTLESRSETLDLGAGIVRQVSGIKMLAQSYELPFEKEVEAFIARLSNAADKVSQIKSPEQLPELRSIIETELRPNLTALKEIIDRGEPPPQQEVKSVTPEIPETPETREAGEAVRRRVDALRRDLDTILEKLPDDTRSSRDVRELLRNVESALNKISDFSYNIISDAPTEDIEVLFENIKIALGQLRTNIQTGQSRLELPPEIKDIVANLQLDFNAADMDKAVTQQIAQLHTLIETLQDSGFTADKRVEAVLAKLTEIVDRLNQLKDGNAPNKWQKILQLLDRELKPNIKLLKEVFNPRDSIQNEVIRDRMTAVYDTVDKLDRQVIQLFEKHAGQTKLAESLDKAENIPGEARDILSKLPRSLQTPENMTRISEIVRHLDSSTLPQEIRPLLSTLRSHFEPLDIGQGAVKLVPKLKTMVEDSGIFFEKKIQDVISRLSEASERIAAVDNLNRLPEIRNIINNDLKPNLMRLQEYLAGEKLESRLGQQETLEVLKKSVEDLLGNINAQQNRAVETQVQQQPVMIFSFNLPIKGEQDAQLKVFYNRGKKREEDGEFKLSLLLNMDRLGEIRTDFSHWEDNLTVTFFVGNYKIKEYIDENLDEIKGPLEAEFKSLNFKVMVSEEQIAAFDMEPAAPQIISDKAVDVKI